ncbi:hypothetical protein BDF22DRAFT_676445 [Syncephalis plumigaleata]|nr:hypothetical protein BDF22DRAFT_676445 [Syncephalis plumigaleata]
MLISNKLYVVALTLAGLVWTSHADTIQVNSPKDGATFCIDKPMSIDYQNMRNGMAIMKSISVDIVQDEKTKLSHQASSERPSQEADWHYMGDISLKSLSPGKYEVQVIGEAYVPSRRNPDDRNMVVKTNVQINVACCGQC